MIVVTIELWPLGSEQRKCELGRMYIANDAKTTSADPKLGSYDVAVCRKGRSTLPQPFNPTGFKPARVGRVENYPRLAYNVWRLIARSLLSAFPEER